MIRISAPKNRLLDDDVIRQALTAALEGRHINDRVLVLVPDHTRSMPLPFLFRCLTNVLNDTRQLDFMIALGTHPPLRDERIRKLMGITSDERHTSYRHVGLLNHAWNSSDALASIGVLPEDQIRQIAGDHWHPSLSGDVEVKVNKAILCYDHILILGPIFPHEVAGFSGGAKYFFPGISGPEMINKTHWLGALTGVPRTIGIKDTPVRAMIHAAAEHIPTPTTLISVVVEGDGLAGMFIGDYHDAWSEAADLSARRHITWVDKPFKKVLSCAPPMYDELWTAGKAMYKLEPALAEGAELTIYAPHLDVVSHAHGRYIYEAGYHVLPYFLEQWDRFKHIPSGVLAHCTHVRGDGTYENGVEHGRASVLLATALSPEDCERLALDHVSPAAIDPAEWLDREGEGILYVPKAGEMLYRIRS